MFDLFGNLIQPQNRCQVSLTSGALRVQTPYNPDFVAAIKGMPRAARTYEPDSKVWLVDPIYHRQVREWIQRFYGEDIGDPPGLNDLQTKPTTRILDVWYLGRTRDTGGDELEATGMNQARQWVYVFPERVLREWFEGFADTGTATTLYGILSIGRVADGDEIKSAYRRMVRQWHPDVCHEQNAAEMFKRIQNAFEILSNSDKRARYDAGLVLTATVDRAREGGNHKAAAGYRSSLRCGYIMAEGVERVGRFVVSKIIAWEDICSERGVLITSWSMDRNEVIETWSNK